MNTGSSRPKSAIPQGSKIRPLSATKKTTLPPTEKERDIKSALPQNSTRNQLKTSQTTTKLPPAIKNPQEFPQLTSRKEGGDLQQLLMNASPAFRFAQPFSSKVDVSQKFWNETNEKSQGLAPNPLSR